jgi:hypothetical protein
MLRHCPFRAAPSAQQMGQAITPAGQGRGATELHQLVTDQREVGTGDQCVVGGIYKDHRFVEQLDFDGRDIVEQQGVPGPQGIDGQAHYSGRGGGAGVDPGPAIESRQQHGPPPAVPPS